MTVVLVGGSGYVGGLVLPWLVKHYSVRVFDLLPPAEGSWEYVGGDVADPDALSRALEGADSLIYMATGAADDDGSFNSTKAADDAFDVSVKGLYFALDAARRAGISHAVYTSTMSIYRGPVERRRFAREDIIPDALDVYGFTKNLGEEVCRHAVRAWGMSVNALRLCLPVSAERWDALGPEDSPVHTSSDDLARALVAALKYRRGFEAFMISGDRNHTRLNLSKARRLLKWEPRAAPAGGPRSGAKSAVLGILRRVRQTKY